MRDRGFGYEVMGEIWEQVGLRLRYFGSWLLVRSFFGGKHKSGRKSFCISNAPQDDNGRQGVRI